MVEQKISGIIMAIVGICLLIDTLVGRENSHQSTIPTSRSTTMVLYCQDQVDADNSHGLESPAVQRHTISTFSRWDIKIAIKRWRRKGCLRNKVVAFGNADTWLSAFRL
jgi:hypothetical protein